MIVIGDRVRVGEKLAWGTVVDFIPGNEYREDVYLVRFDQKIVAPTLTPNPNESWIDASLVYGPFVDQPDQYSLYHRYY